MGEWGMRERRVTWVFWSLLETTLVWIDYSYTRVSRLVLVGAHHKTPLDVQGREL